MKNRYAPFPTIVTINHGRRWVAMCFIILFWNLPVWSQNSKIVESKRSYTVREGLSHNHVYQTFKDSRGILWLITGAKINWFDGKEFHAVNHPDLFWMADGTILLEDDENDLWIRRRDAQLFFLNINTLKIRTVAEKFGTPTIKGAHEVIRGRSNTYLVQTLSYDKVVRMAKGKPIKVLVERQSKLVAPLVEFEDGTIWFECNENGRGGELFATNAVGAPMVTIRYPEDHIYSKGVWGKDTVFYLTRDSICLATGQGVVLRKALKEIYPGYRFTNPYDSGDFPQCKVSPDGNRVWWYFPHTLLAFDKQFNLYWETPDTRSMFLSGHLFDILPDRQNNLWIGAMDGLCRIRIKNNPFECYLEEKETPDHRLPLHSCRGIQQASDGQMYVLAAPNLYRLEKNGGATTVFTGTEEDEPQMRALHADGEGNLWFTGRHVYAFNIFTGIVTTYPVDPSFKMESWSLLREKDLLWIGGPLMVYDLKKKRLEYFLQTNDFDQILFKNLRIYQIHPQDSVGIWLVSNQGLFLIDREKGAAARYWSKGEGKYHLPFDDLRHLYIDAKGVFWLAGAHGIVHLLPETGKFRLLKDAEGFPPNCHAVLPDSMGHLWVSSDFGLIRYNLQSERSRHYTVMDGIPSDEFNRLSYGMSSSGKLYFGGLNGVVGVDPRQFTKLGTRRLPEAQLVLTEGFLFKRKTNKEVDILEGWQKNGRIDIFPGDGFLRLNFALTDLTSPTNLAYAYTIEGYEKEWHVGKECELLLSGLPYGSYTLVVRAGSGGLWSSEHLFRMPIKVWPPVYLRPWFLVPFLLALGGSIVWGIRKRVADLKKRAQLLEHAVQERTVIINNQQQRLKQLYDFKTRMYSNVTHEFKTPLTLILGPATRAKRMKEVQASQELRSVLDQVITNGGQMLKLVEELLMLNKLESNYLQADYSYGNVVAFVRSTAEQFFELTRGKNLYFTISADTDVLMMDFDSLKTEKIINNLLSNAVKFTPSGGTVAVRMSVDGGWLQVEVSDTGRGIAPENLPLVFDRFFQEETSFIRRSEGTGIGLALVKELTELLGGTISVLSRQGEGSVFTFKLPIRHHPDSAPYLQVLQSSMPETTSFPLPEKEPEHADAEEKPLVLVIEDNVALANYTVSCLRDNYQVVAVTDSAEGLAVARERVPDIVVCDIMMPGMDGFEVCSTLKTQESTSHIPFMFLTALSEQAERLRRIQAGADAFLSKPFTEEEILAQIEQLLVSRKQLQTWYLMVSRESAQDSTKETTPSELSAHEVQFLQTVRGHIHEKLDEAGLDGKSLARTLGMSHPQLHRKLTALTGLSVGRFLHRIRLEEAQRLLLDHPELSISEIAYRTGFSDPAYFSRLFTKAFGGSPSAFRDKNNVH